MNIVILAVGRLRASYRDACDEYLQRLGRHARISEVEVREASRAPTAAVQREQEAGRLLQRLPPGATLVALAREGEAWSSRDLARQLQRWQLAGRPLAVALGGSHGLGPEILARASARWSLGRLTLPHELARVVVAEQLYRAFAILRGEPYHKGS